MIALAYIQRILPKLFCICILCHFRFMLSEELVLLNKKNATELKPKLSYLVSINHSLSHLVNI